ncbi:DUF2147 domain-containing protein [uncultured Cohaesibacter sp.]|uniref:DUF2147 domain-containing protein n=1 Tax=uncultured Cohaesibacter sp. TaxID=1002546 RepID=UPI002AAC281B|nr:DUF2147 domain-containing protein [uncultured Cohaesibacter sp.]
MRSIATIFALLVAAPALADPVFGEWKTQSSAMEKYAGHYLHVRFEPCGSKICGKITKVVGIEADIIGKVIIWDMKAKADGSYTGGKIWPPDRGGTYSSKMKLQGDKLKVSGCLAGGLLCESQTWSRL